MNGVITKEKIIRLEQKKVYVCNVVVQWTPLFLLTQKKYVLLIVQHAKSIIIKLDIQRTKARFS